MEWRVVRGFPLYQVNQMGGIRRVWSKKYTPMTPYKVCRHGNTYYVVKLSDGTGKSTAVKASYVVARAFLPPKPSPNHVLYHKNGDIDDHCARNLGWITRSALGKKTGAQSRRKPVSKMDRDFNIVETYTSARAAGRANFMSYQTVMDRCNNKVKNEFGLTGYTFRWDRRYEE